MRLVCGSRGVPAHSFAKLQIASNAKATDAHQYFGRWKLTTSNKRDMKRAGLAILLALFSITWTTAREPYGSPFNMMTGNQVLQKLLADTKRPSDYVERDIAQAYVNGIKDGTEGTVWCFVGVILPHELNNELAWDLKEKHTPDELRGNAAPLILTDLRRRYPCTGRTRK